MTPPRILAVIALCSALSAACAPTQVCLVKGVDASVDDDAFDKALEEANKLFGPAGITLSRGGSHQLSEGPSMPEENGAKRTPDQQKIIDAAKKMTAGDKWKLQIIVVKNFKKAGGGGGPPPINGVTATGGPVIIVEPPAVEENTMGRGRFSRTLAHEIGHALGLGHEKLPGDRTTGEDPNAQYAPPNLMAPDGDGTDTGLTPDQIDALKKNAPKIL